MKTPLAITGAALLVAVLLWWITSTDSGGGRDPAPEPTAGSSHPATLRGRAVDDEATVEVPPVEPAFGGFDVRDWFSEGPAYAPPPSPKAALTSSELRAAGFDQTLPAGTVGGVVIIDGKPVEAGEGLLWKIPTGALSNRAIPVAREPDARARLLRDGRFRFGGIEDDRYLIGVKLADGIPRLLWTFDQPVKGRRPEALIVLGSGTIEGHVRDETGAPATGWRVRADSHSGPGNVLSSAVVGRDGSYRIGLLRAGPHGVILDDPLSSQSHTGVRRYVQVTKDETTRVDFGDARPVRFRGTVRLRSGEPTRRAGLVEARAGDGKSARISYDKHGAYDHLLEAGTWSFRLHFGGNRYAHINGVRLTHRNANRNLDVDMTWIEGRVLHPPGSMPREVRFWPVGTKLEVGFVRLDGDGRFYVPGFGTGRWNFRVAGKGAEHPIVTVELRGGDGPQEIELQTGG